MRKNLRFLFALSTLLLILCTASSFSHPGRTDSKGGHYDKHSFSSISGYKKRHRLFSDDALVRTVYLGFLSAVDHGEGNIPIDDDLYHLVGHIVGCDPICRIS